METKKPNTIEGSARVARHTKDEYIWLASSQICNDRARLIGSRVRVAISVLPSPRFSLAIGLVLDLFRGKK